MTIQEVQQLSQKHQGEFKSLALTLTHDEERARDLLQDVIYLVLKHRESYKTGTNFVAWVKTIIRNTFISEYRQKKRRRELVQRDRPRKTWLGDHAIENMAESTLGVEELMQFIGELPDDYRRSFLLHFQGNKYKDIARIMNVPIGTAKSRVFAARTLLKARLHTYGITRSV